MTFPSIWRKTEATRCRSTETRAPKHGWGNRGAVSPSSLGCNAGSLASPTGGARGLNLLPSPQSSGGTTKPVSPGIPQGVSRDPHGGHCPGRPESRPSPSQASLRCKRQRSCDAHLHVWRWQLVWRSHRLQRREKGRGQGICSLTALPRGDCMPGRFPGWDATFTPPRPLRATAAKSWQTHRVHPSGQSQDKSTQPSAQPQGRSAFLTPLQGWSRPFQSYGKAGSGSGSQA